MTDEELSELEEFIDQRCREAVASGMRLTFCTTFDSGRCCPLGAATRQESPRLAGLFLGLSETAARSFAHAFDGGDPALESHMALHYMGRRFRERFLAGEYRP